MCKPSISANAVAVRVAEVSLPSVTEGAIRRDCVVFDDKVRRTSGYILLANVFDRKFAGWNDDADAAFGVGIKNFAHGFKLAEDGDGNCNWIHIYSSCVVMRSYRK